MFDLKDRFYYFAIDRNPKIKKYYHAFVDADPQRHRRNPLRSYSYLLYLNFIFRLLRRRDLSNSIFFKQLTPGAKRPPKPYLDGAESELVNRPIPVKLAHSYLAYDVISFDIFDTLILRPFGQPVDLFYLVGEKLQIPKFHVARVVAEREARDIALAKYGHREITIRDIYERVAKLTGVDPDTGIKTEFETELELCFANPYMLQFFKMMRSVGKKLVAVSDMYLPRDYMTRLLQKCGYSGFDNVIVSCDYKQSKRGELFSMVKAMYPNAAMIHFGDNKASDGRSEAYGIPFFHYRSCNGVGTPFRPDDMSPVIGSAYCGIVNAHLHNGKERYSIPYEFGFIYGGLYLLGYCSFIHKYCVRKKIDKVLFISRDGEIITRVFNELYDDIPCELFYWSRNAMMRYASDYNRYHYISLIIGAWVQNADPSSTVRQMFEALEFPESLYADLPNYRLSADEAVLYRQFNLRNFLYDHADAIAKLHEDDKEIFKGYVRGVLGDGKRILIVDVGSTGDSTFSLKRLIEEEVAPGVECDIVLAVFRDEFSPWLSLRHQIESYVCSLCHNQNTYNDFRTQNGLPYSIFELFNEALRPSFQKINVDENGARFHFMSPEVENYPTIRELQKGIMDFCRIYSKTFRNYPYMMDIPGQDAVAPYRLLTPFVADFFLRHFPDYVHNLAAILSDEIHPGLFSDIIKSRLPKK